MRPALGRNSGSRGNSQLRQRNQCLSSASPEFNADIALLRVLLRRRSPVPRQGGCALAQVSSSGIPKPSGASCSISLALPASTSPACVFRSPPGSHTVRSRDEEQLGRRSSDAPDP